MALRIVTLCVFCVRVCVFVRACVYVCACIKVTLTRLFKVLVGRGPGVSEVHQAGFHGSEVHLRAVTPGVLGAALAPAVPLPTHELALFVAADVAERSLHKARPQVLWQYGLQAWG